jgi:hypothetical protein
VYYGYRYLSTDKGRWLNRDPMEEAGGENLGAFVLNDPISGIDLLGLAEQTDTKCSVLYVLARENSVVNGIPLYDDFERSARRIRVECQCALVSVAEENVGQASLQAQGYGIVALVSHGKRQMRESDMARNRRLRAEHEEAVRKWREGGKPGNRPKRQSPPDRSLADYTTYLPNVQGESQPLPGVRVDDLVLPESVEVLFLGTCNNGYAPRKIGGTPVVPVFPNVWDNEPDRPKWDVQDQGTQGGTNSRALVAGTERKILERLRTNGCCGK